MTAKIFALDTLVCVLALMKKEVAYFCGYCTGTGEIGLGTCSECQGRGLCKTSMSVPVFAGVGKIVSVFALSSEVTYTVTYPLMAGWLDHSFQDQRQTMDMSLAEWKKADNGKLKSSITYMVSHKDVFETYGEMLKGFDARYREVINENVKKLGGVIGVFDDNPNKNNKYNDTQACTTPTPECTQNDTSKKPYGVAQVSDKLWATEFRNNVQRLFVCPQCKGNPGKCTRCHTSGKVQMFIPQYILLGMVEVASSTNKNQWINLNTAPVQYVDDDSQKFITRNYWVNRADGTEHREPKSSGALWDNLFYSYDAAHDWLLLRNADLLKSWCKEHADYIPIGRNGEAMDEYKPKVFPKKVPIEACLC